MRQTKITINAILFSGFLFKLTEVDVQRIHRLHITIATQLPTSCATITDDARVNQLLCQCIQQPDLTAAAAALAKSHIGPNVTRSPHLIIAFARQPSNKTVKNEYRKYNAIHSFPNENWVTSLHISQVQERQTKVSDIFSQYFFT